MGGTWETWNMDFEPGKSKWMAKGNPEEMPRKSNSNCHEGATQWFSLPLSLLMGLSTHTIIFSPLNRYLFHYLPFLWEFFSAKSKGQGPCHWPLVQWLGSGAFTTAMGINLSWSPSLTPSHCRLRPLEIKTRWAYCCNGQGESKRHTPWESIDCLRKRY